MVEPGTDDERRIVGNVRELNRPIEVAHVCPPERCPYAHSCSALFFQPLL